MVSDLAHHVPSGYRGPFIASFHNAIKDVIPQIVVLLQDKDNSVQIAGSNAIGELANHRE